jgi:hypothetical protein
MNLYIRNHTHENTQPWWDRFEAALVPRYGGKDALQKHIEDRVATLDAHGARLRWDKDRGVPYLKFNSEKDLSWFMLKWS